MNSHDGAYGKPSGGCPTDSVEEYVPDGVPYAPDGYDGLGAVSSGHVLAYTGD